MVWYVNEDQARMNLGMPKSNLAETGRSLCQVYKDSKKQAQEESELQKIRAELHQARNDLIMLEIENEARMDTLAELEKALPEMYPEGLIDDMANANYNRLLDKAGEEGKIIRT